MAILSSIVVLASILMMLYGVSLPFMLALSHMHIPVSVVVAIAPIHLIGGDILIDVRDQRHSVRVLNVLHVPLFSELWQLVASPEVLWLVFVILMADSFMRMLELVIVAHDQMVVTVV